MKRIKITQFVNRNSNLVPVSCCALVVKTYRFCLYQFMFKKASPQIHIMTKTYTLSPKQAHFHSQTKQDQFTTARMHITQKCNTVEGSNPQECPVIPTQHYQKILVQCSSQDTGVRSKRFDHLSTCLF